MLENSGIEINFVVLVIAAFTVVFIALKFAKKSTTKLSKIRDTLMSFVIMIFGFFSWDYFLMGFNDLFNLTKFLSQVREGMNDPSINTQLLMLNTVINFAIIGSFNYILLRLFTFKKKAHMSKFEMVLSSLKYDSLASSEELNRRNPGLKRIPLVLEHYNLLFFVFLEFSALVITTLTNSGLV